MTDRVFPIQQGTACNNKWTWSTLWLARGTTASCHRVRPHHVSLDQLANFHNTSEKLDQRRRMLAGEWPQEGCDYCQRIEEAGGKSDRQNSNERWEWVPKEIADGDPVLSVTPRVVEIFINNTCQMKCLYCDPGLSSSIQRENHEHGQFSIETTQGARTLLWDADYMLPEKSQYFTEFMRWLDINHAEIKRLHVLGGEPFLQGEMQQIVDFFHTHPSPDLDLNVVSNLMVKQKNMQRYIDQLAELSLNNHLGTVHITGSIDTWGQDAEYVRNGLDLTVFEQNLRYLLENTGIDTVGIYQVITCLTLGRAPELYDKILEWRQIRPDLQYYFQLNTDWNRDFLHPKHWRSTVWQHSMEQLIGKMIQHSDHLVPEIQGIWLSIQNAEPDPEMVDICHRFLDELDRRRGTNWRQIWNYL